MTTFRFGLQRVLDWRRTQLQLAEARLRQQAAVLAELDRAREELEQAAVRAQREVCGYHPLEGRDLAALGSFHLMVKVRAVQMASQRVELQRGLAARQAEVVEARRRCRLLERIEEKRRTVWQAACDRELEDLAADSYLSQWNRRAAAPPI